MSYHFDQLLSNQTGFESTEQLFCNFLQSIIKIIIEPFRISYGNNKFNNIPKSDLDQVNKVFIIIEQIYQFHKIAKDKLSLILAETNTNNISNTNNANNNNKTISPHSGLKRMHYRSGHSKSSSSFSPQISLIFEYYESFPKYYQQYFHQILCSLKLLSQIVSPRTKLKQWLRSKCEQILLLKPEQRKMIKDDNINNEQENDNNEIAKDSYQSLADVLYDIFTHWIFQSNFLNHLASTSKYLKEEYKAQLFSQHTNDYLVNHLIVLNEETKTYLKGKPFLFT